MVADEWFEDRFDPDGLNRATWLPHYLPAWSSREASRAAWECGSEGLTLSVPVDHPVWCPGDHEPPLRVSGVQSGSWSGPVGSPRGQQRFRDDQVVREAQELFEGWLPGRDGRGHVEVTARMALSPRSMAALWLSGFEDDPAQEQCGELCVVEVFGRALGTDPGAPSADVGVGVKPFRDPRLGADFAAPRLGIDVRQPHTYGVTWDADGAVFTVDGREVRRCDRAPSYRLQVMVAVFDFPQWSVGGDDDLVPSMTVERIAGSR